MAPRSWPDLISQVIARDNLTAADTAWAMDQVMKGDTSPVVLAAFLAALATKGETAAEIKGLTDSMLSHARPIRVNGECLDIVGTGGDRLATVNISTMAAVIVAAGGVPVVKHGNRAASSKCGSADVLEALGINLMLPVEGVEETFEKLGITFCFANYFHPSMRFAAQARRELGVATAFNILGPLTNPARPTASVIGVYDAKKAPLVAQVLAERGSRALVFRGDNGMDELSAVVPNTVWEVLDGEITEHRVHGEDLGLAPAAVEDLRGGDSTHNAEVFRCVLAGESGPMRDAVCLNAAAAFVAKGTHEGTRPADGSIEERLRAGLEIARQTIDEGAAARLVEDWVELSASLSEQYGAG